MCVRTARGKNQYIREWMTRMNGKQAKAIANETETMQGDIAILLQMLHLGDYARDMSPHAVMIGLVIPAVRKLTERTIWNERH